MAKPKIFRFFPHSYLLTNGIFYEQTSSPKREPALHGTECSTSGWANNIVKSPDLDERSNTRNESIQTCYSQTAYVRDSDKPYDICFGMVSM